MYTHILVTLENAPADKTILAHVRQLGKLTGARLTLVHVADGFFARNQEQFDESDEIRDDRAYLSQCREELEADGFEVKTILACGEPGEQILLAAQDNNCDLIAMATHGHRGLSDIVLGSVASHVRHRTFLPVLLLKAPLSPKP